MAKRTRQDEQALGPITPVDMPSIAGLIARREADVREGRLLEAMPTVRVYSLNAHAEPSIWLGPRRPTQAQIDAALVEHFIRPRHRVLELRLDGALIGSVAHDDYEPWGDDNEWSGGFGEHC